MKKIDIKELIKTAWNSDNSWVGASLVVMLILIVLIFVAIFASLGLNGFFLLMGIIFVGMLFTLFKGIKELFKEYNKKQ